MIINKETRLLYLVFVGTLLCINIVNNILGLSLLTDSYILSTLIIVLSLIGVAIENQLISASTVIYLIIVSPAISPFYSSEVIGVKYFARYSLELQDDPLLIGKVMALYAVAGFFYYLMIAISKKKRIIFDATCTTCPYSFSTGIIFLLVSCTLFFAYWVQPGQTLITSNYSEISKVNLHGINKILGQAGSIFFPIFWSILFLLGRKRKVIFLLSTTMIFVWFALHARRVEILGIMMVLILWAKESNSKIMSNKFIILFSGLIVVLTLTIIGYTRDTSWSNQDLSVISFSNLGRFDENVATLPASTPNHVFMTTIHFVHIQDDGLIADRNLAMIDAWLLNLVPQSILSLVSINQPNLESDAIFKRSGVPYIGGMHLIGAMYNFGGVLIVILYGLIFGYLSILVNSLFKNLQYGFDAVNCKNVILILFVLMQFRIQWYHPMIFFRQIEYLLLIWFFIYIVVHTIRIKRRQT